MDPVALVVAIVALIVSAVAVVYTRRSARAAEQAAAAADRQAAESRREADAADEQVRLAYAPKLTISMMDGGIGQSHWQYKVRNDGHQDLDSVIVERPRTSDQVRYCVARTGSSDFQDQVELGPLQLGEASFLLLAVGATPNPPEFHVRITCRADGRSWTVSRLLEAPSRGNRVWAF